jgi:hypothetical protein
MVIGYRRKSRLNSNDVVEVVVMSLSIVGVVVLNALGHNVAVVDNGLFALAGAAAGHAFGRGKNA